MGALDDFLASEMGRVAVAGTGFLADGYDLFIIGLAEIVFSNLYVASGLVSKEDYAVHKGTMASAALFGAVIGQVFFGTLADRIGRRIVFIVTAILIVLGSLLSCMAMDNLIPGAGPGQLFVQIAVARFIMGIGIGGEYPLSASIASEGCSKRRSATLMALVFSNQGLGYLLACLVMLMLVVSGCSLELTWRVALGFGAVVPAVALPFRMMMHESEDFEKVQKQRHDHNGTVDARTTMKRYMWHAVGTAVNWFLWDIVWYANGLFSQDIAAVMSGFGDGIEGIVTKKLVIVLCMLPGYALSVMLLNKLGRKNIQIMGYIASAVLFAICGLAYADLKTGAPWLFFSLYACTFLFANFGPNTTTYVIPGEIFPTQIKATFHGLSAATGKIGGVVGAELFPLLHPEEDEGKVVCLVLCAVIAMAGAIFTIVFTPRYEAEDLERMLPSETVGYVPLRWQRKEHHSKLDAHEKSLESIKQGSNGVATEEPCHASPVDEAMQAEVAVEV